MLVPATDRDYDRRKRMKTHTKETRSIVLPSAKTEVRQTSKGRTAVGYSIVFPPAISSDLGGFVEQIDSNAVNIQRNNVWALRAHDTTRQIASTDAGTARLSKDKIGIRHEIDLPPTTDGNDLAALLARGDGGQCSFGFVCISDSWQEKNGVVLRTVTELELLEISIGVIFPAYGDTKSSLRSAPEWVRTKLKVRSDVDDTCNCECDSCDESGDCDGCTDPDCTDENCSACPMQEDRKRADSVRIRRLFASRIN
jgi:Escherichia/Staphylococcus phage prohead protease